MFEGYKLVCQANGYKPKGSRSFFSNVRKYIRTNAKLGIDPDKQVHWGGKHKWLFAIQDHSTHRDNCDQYVINDGHDRKWIGPNVPL